MENRESVEVREYLEKVAPNCCVKISDTGVNRLVSINTNDGKYGIDVVLNGEHDLHKIDGAVKWIRVQVYGE